MSCILEVYQSSQVQFGTVHLQKNEEDLERVQKAAVRIIIGKEYTNYEDALIKADLESLKERRENLCKTFAKKSLKSDNIRANTLFKEKEKPHKMKLRQDEKYEVDFASTRRLQKSSIPYMQRLLNIDDQNKNQNNKRKKVSEEVPQKKRRKPGQL